MTKTYSPEFESFREVYPRRDKPDDWSLAYRNWKTRLKEPDVTAEILTTCAKEYGAYLARKGKLGTEFVLCAATFLGPHERWKPYLPVKTIPRAPCAQAVVESEPVVNPEEGKRFVREIIQGLTRRVP